MRLCFGSFVKTLRVHRKNSSISGGTIGRKLFDIIDPSYSVNREESYIYKFINQRREIVKELKSKDWDITALTQAFDEFCGECLSINTDPLVEDLRHMITEDDMLVEKTKVHLFKLSKETNVPVFLAELFVFIVDNTINKNVRKGEKRANGTRELINRMEKITDNELLEDLARVAIKRQDLDALDYALEKMKNHIYKAKVLVAISQYGGYAPNTPLDEIFHKYLSGVTNNKYRHDILSECLEKGFFRNNPELLLDPHLMEYTNQLYLYNTLCYMYSHGFNGEALRYGHLLTNKRYVKYFGEFIAGQAGDAN